MATVKVLFEILLCVLCLVEPNAAFLVKGDNGHNVTHPSDPVGKDAMIAQLVQDVFELKTRVNVQEQEIETMKSQQSLVHAVNETGFPAIKLKFEDLEHAVKDLTDAFQKHVIQYEETNRTIHRELDILNTKLTEFKNITNRTITLLQHDLQSEITNLTVIEAADVNRLDTLILTEKKVVEVEIGSLKTNIQKVNNTLTGILRPTGIRLRDGDASSGRVEVKFLGSWGTVCDDDFGVEEAKLVCTMLGKSATNAQAFGGAHYGQGNGTIVYDDLHCIGHEPDLFDCPHSELGQSNCDHSEDAGVSCG